MSDLELKVFRTVDFNWTRDLPSVGTDSPYAVDDLHRDTLEDVMEHFVLRTKKPQDNPIGKVILGQAGSGKTHLIGSLRRRVWDAGGWFVLLDVVGVTDFWGTAALGFLNSLHHSMPDGRAQYEAVLSRIVRNLPLDAEMKQAIADWERIQGGTRRNTTGLFLKILQYVDPANMLKHHDVVRGILLLGSEDWDARNLAYCWLQGLDADEVKRKELGFSRPPPPFHELIRGMLWLMSLGGPVLIAVDQIDGTLSASNLLAGSDDEPRDDNERGARSIITQLANGLMDLHDLKRQALTVVSCLEATWPIIKSRALKSASQRFQETEPLRPIFKQEVVEKLIRDRLEATYSEYKFKPRYPTWPFLPDAISSATGLLPRIILMRCDEHQRRCKTAGKVLECHSLSNTTPALFDRGEHDFQADFKERCEKAVTTDVLNWDTEDTLAVDLLNDIMTVYTRHFKPSEDIDINVHRDPDVKRPSLHARLSFTLHKEGDREQQYCFRAIGHSHSNAFQARLRAAMTASGVDHALNFRHLFIIRRDYHPAGAKTAELVEKFKTAGGMFIVPTEEDLRIFVALQAMLKANKDGFNAWLRHAKPLFKSPLFQAAGLCPPKFLPQDPPATDPPPTPPSPSHGPRSQADNPHAGSKFTSSTNGTQAATIGTSSEPHPETSGQLNQSQQIPNATNPNQTARSGAQLGSIPLGHRFERGAPGPEVSLSADLLKRHVAILAGSGSGKTVLLRRLVEEAALLGLPAIVLDTNNDLARLGDPWPTRPAALSDGDAARADEYQKYTDVMVWTPGLNGGRPMSLPLLPDFAAVKDNDDERDQAVEMARATLTPFVGVRGATGNLKEGVLVETLQLFANKGGGSLNDLIYLLSDLPEDVSQISNAQRHAAAIADQLHAAIARNPLLKSQGAPLDPQLLFAGSSGKPRISVINFSGLQSDQARQSFVNQLQMSLFSWIKRNPSPTGWLYVLDEAQNFAPSSRMTPCKGSTISLVAQARKYGLGMIFATQAPKDIDNRIVSNCTTHFYGRMGSSATLETVRELMSAKGGAADDIGRLSKGEFYYSTEGVARPVKIRTPLCLTYHPANPLTAEEVVAKARPTS